MLKDSPTSHIYFSQRLKLHYVAWGDPEAPVLMLIHGGRDHCRNWDWVATALKDDYFIIAPDLRGHGDSQWMVGGAYSIVDFIYDIQQLVRQTQIDSMRVIGHSLGAIVALLYSGNYPEKVNRLIAVEGMGIMLNQWRMATNQMHEHIRGWVEDVHRLSGRQPRRYTTLEEAIQRLQNLNPHLSAERARHLTIHGSIQNEDGTFSWKFDNYFRVLAPITLSYEETKQLCARISCPTLLVHGQDSWVLHPSQDERVKTMQDVKVHSITNAGHWCHHDQFDEFLQIVRDFL